MRRIALMATVGVVFLLAVSVGVGQFAPPSVSNAPPPATQPPGLPSGYTPAVTPLPVPRPRTIPGPSDFTLEPPPFPPVAVGPGERMTVKVYSVPDLVAAVQDPATPGPFGANAELAQAMQQLQYQIQAAQTSYQAASATQPPNAVAQKLERLKKALRVAAPKRSWEDDGGEGVIEIYAEALCLIVRQTETGHEAIADLLSQLRATQDVQIELTVEMLVFEGVADELAAEAIKLLNKEMSPEELAQFRQCGAATATMGIVRMPNGRSANAGMIPTMPLQFTAVASADQSIVQFRTDVSVPIGDDVAVLHRTFGQSRTVAVGKTLAYMLDGEGAVVLLVTPKIVDRSPPAAM